MKKNVGSRLPSFTEKESNLMKRSIDFLGINSYSSFYVKNFPESYARYGSGNKMSNMCIV
jgi:beta-glucosidase